MSQDGAKGPLDGIVVLDLTTMLAGPFATMILGDLGARIIKIEAPFGDSIRNSARLRGDDDPKSFGGYFQSINRNKESLVLDLKKASAQEAFKRLVKDADIVVENFRSGVMSRLGLPYETLKELNPKLVYGALRGFGDRRTGESPYDEWPAFDVVAQAMGGIMGITGLKGGPPLKVGAGVGDTVPALFFAIGILSALHRAKNTSEAQFIDVGMYDSIVAICERIIYQRSYLGEIPGPEGSGHPLLCPFGIFPASDGYLSIGCPRDHFWQILTEEMGCPELAQEPRFRTNEDRVANRESVDTLVANWSIRFTKAELISRLAGRIPLGPVNSAADIMADPHIAARSMLATVEQPGPNGRAVQIANTPIHFLETPGGVRHRAPLMGEHTSQILSDFGFGKDEIAALFEECAIA
ncbi:MAG: CoA transferase [Notoacmeibacter sp.]|nr:CoA transferase [Notoacmeibacter sp.]